MELKVSEPSPGPSVVTPGHTVLESGPSVAVAPPAPRRRRGWLWLLVLVLGGISGYVLLWGPHATQGQAKVSAATTATSADNGAGSKDAVPVVAATTRTGDMGVYLSGLGTVTPLYTVTVHSRVDGELVDVAFQEGQLVKKGDLLARIDPRPFEVQLEQAEGQKTKDEATLKNTKLDLTRYQDLAERGIVPKQQVDTQVSTVNQAEGAVASDQGQIDAAKLNLVYSQITAPIGGRVGLRLVDPGNIVHAADTSGLVVIAQLDPIAVVFTIAEDSLQQVLRQMQRGTALTVEAFDRDAKVKLATGKLLTVDNEIDQTTGTVKLKALFQNPKNELFPNQFVNARVLVDTIHNTVIVPSAAIQRSPNATFVYAIKPDKTVELKNVEVRLTEGEETAIKSGLTGGELVVTDGVDKLQPGSSVSTR